ncbi:hypothetical protein D4R89_03610 [bacterium]|nr:MAG: hypothetical protein D4R89_03610 [bacterium]
MYKYADTCRAGRGASRSDDLRRYLEAELPKLTREIAESQTVLETRLDRLDKDLRSVIEQAGNSLAAACIGKREYRLERGKMETFQT